MNKTKHNCLLCILSLQSISYSSVLKTQLEMFSKCAQYKKHTQESTRKTTKPQHRVKGILSSRDPLEGVAFFRWPLTNAMPAFSSRYGVSPRSWWGGYTSLLARLHVKACKSPHWYISVWISMVYQLVNWLNYKQKRAVNQKKSARCNYHKWSIKLRLSNKQRTLTENNLTSTALE